MSKSRLLMVTGLLCVLPELLPTLDAAQAYEASATTRVAMTPSIPYPGYLQPATDAAFGTLTDPGRQMLSGLSCKSAYCTLMICVSGSEVYTPAVRSQISSRACRGWSQQC